MTEFSNRGHGSVCSFRLTIADVTLEIQFDREFSVPLPYEKFRTRKDPDIRVVVSEAIERRACLGYKVGHIHGIGPIWACGERKYCIDFERSGMNAKTRAFVEFNLDSGEVRYSLGQGRTYDQFFDSRFFDFILNQAVKTYLLVKLRNGLVLHACGVEYRGHGVGFVGRSGAGKTTLARLWRTRERCCVLNDDTVVVTWRDGIFYLWGTPWTSLDHETASPSGCILNSLFFIDHGASNSAIPVSGTRALHLVLSGSSRDWSKESGLCAIEQLCKMSTVVRLYEFRFVPNQSAIDFIVDLLGLAEGSLDCLKLRCRIL